jgi:DNA-binding MarR family transcriptional regulator
MSQAAELEPLDENVGYVLKQAAVALHAAMDTALRPCGLTLSQYACLEQLSRTPSRTNAELARATFVTPQSMNEVLRGLQARGLVERPERAETGRARPTRLTTEGARAVDRARSALGPVDDRMGSFAAPDERRQTLAGLRAIIRALESGDGDGLPTS